MTTSEKPRHTIILCDDCGKPLSPSSQFKLEPYSITSPQKEHWPTVSIVFCSIECFAKAIVWQYHRSKSTDWVTGDDKTFKLHRLVKDFE